jgi:hypothetical protein
MTHDLAARVPPDARPDSTAEIETTPRAMSHATQAGIAAAVTLVAIVGLSFVQAERPTASERHRSAIEDVADRYTHAQIADAWTQTKLGNPGPMQGIQRNFPLPARTVQADGDAIILTFFDDRGTCVDFRTGPDRSIVSARRC